MVAINAHVAEESVMRLMCLFSEAMFGLSAVYGDDSAIVHVHRHASLLLISAALGTPISQALNFCFNFIVCMH